LAGQEADDARTIQTFELREGIAVTFAALPENYQNVLRAKYEDQLPIADIAAEWGATSKSVESLLGRARAAFCEMYRRLCGETEDDRGEA
jgi:DNA-directed RNA polymerase specialized sigma24 family protein